jgi:hypothetical protein
MPVVAKNVQYSLPAQAPAGQSGQIGPPLMTDAGLKKIRSQRVRCTKSGFDLRPHLKSLRADAGPQPNQNILHRGVVHHRLLQQALQHTHAALACQTAPTGMRGCHPSAGHIAHQNRQTVGHHDRAGHASLHGQTSISRYAIHTLGLEQHDLIAMRLP